MPRHHLVFKYDTQPDISTEDRKALRGMVTGEGSSPFFSREQLAERAQSIREEATVGRFQIQQQNLELTRMRDLANMMKARAAMDLQMRTEQHTVRALETLGQLDPKKDDYHLRVAEVFHDNPLAAKDPLIQDMVKAQIAERHVQQTMQSEITKHEETQGSEFSRQHGVDVIRNKEGRIDWNASFKAANEAEKQRQAEAVAGVDPSLKRLETKIVDGKVTDTFKAPPAIPPTTITTTTKASGVEGVPDAVTTVTKRSVPAGAPTTNAPGSMPPVTVSGVTIGQPAPGKPSLSDIFQ